MLNVQVAKGKLCSQRRMLNSMFARVKQEHTAASLRKKRIAHVLSGADMVQETSEPGLSHLAFLQTELKFSGTEVSVPRMELAIPGTSTIQCCPSRPVCVQLPSGMP